jgi:DNA sulfur modification protein DndB
MREYPGDWKAKVQELGTVDWKKSNRDWENICIVAGSVVSNRQARQATKAYLKRHLGLPLSDAEHKSLPATSELVLAGVN